MKTARHVSRSHAQPPVRPGATVPTAGTAHVVGAPIAKGGPAATAQGYNGRRIELAQRHRFTLVELLVVIAVIAILMALLLPVLSYARERSKRVVCLSNLRQWGMALNLYYKDNDGFPPESYKTSHSPDGRWPNVMRLNPEVDPPWTSVASQPDAISVRMFMPYIPGFDMDGMNATGVWRCPSARPYPDNSEWVRGWERGDWFYSNYSYYGRVSLWEQHATKPERLIDRLPSGERLIMSDATWTWWYNGEWSYNHGRTGPVYFTLDGSGWDTVPGNFAGQNQLRGDGSGRWKGVDEFDVQAMEHDPQSVPSIRQRQQNSPENDVATDGFYYY